MRGDVLEGGVSIGIVSFDTGSAVVSNCYFHKVNTKIEVEKQLLEEALDALLGYQEKVDGEFGMAPSNDQIERDGDTDPVIVKLRDALKA